MATATRKKPQEDPALAAARQAVADREAAVKAAEAEIARLTSRMEGPAATITDRSTELEGLQAERRALLDRHAGGEDVAQELTPGRQRIPVLQGEIGEAQELHAVLRDHLTTAEQARQSAQAALDEARGQLAIAELKAEIPGLNAEAESFAEHMTAFWRKYEDTRRHVPYTLADFVRIYEYELSRTGIRFDWQSLTFTLPTIPPDLI